MATSSRRPSRCTCSSRPRAAISRTIESCSGPFPTETSRQSGCVRRSASNASRKPGQPFSALRRPTVRKRWVVAPAPTIAATRSRAARRRSRHSSAPHASLASFRVDKGLASTSTRRPPSRAALLSATAGPTATIRVAAHRRHSDSIDRLRVPAKRGCGSTLWSVATTGRRRRRAATPPRMCALSRCVCTTSGSIRRRRRTRSNSRRGEAMRDAGSTWVSIRA